MKTHFADSQDGKLGRDVSGSGSGLVHTDTFKSLIAPHGI